MEEKPRQRAKQPLPGLPKTHLQQIKLRSRQQEARRADTVDSTVAPVMFYRLTFLAIAILSHRIPLEFPQGIHVV